MLEGKYRNMLTFYKVYTGMYVITIHLKYTEVFNDLIEAVEAAKQGVTVGKDTVSGLMFADDFVGMQKQIEKALQYTRKWRATANVKKCAVLILLCNENKVNPATFKWKQGEDELPIADQYTYVGVEMS